MISRYKEADGIKKIVLKLKYKRLIAVLVVFSVLATFIGIRLQNRAYSLLADTADARMRSIISTLTSESLISIMSSSVEFSDLVNISTDSYGKVSYLTADSFHLTALSQRTAGEIQERLDELAEQSIAIRVFALLGSDLFAGMGPVIRVKVQPLGNTEIKYISEFTSAGINQTCHRIYMDITVHVSVVMPTGAKKTTVSTQAAVSECILIGVVPESYIYVDETEKMLNLIPD